MAEGPDGIAPKDSRRCLLPTGKKEKEGIPFGSKKMSCRKLGTSNTLKRKIKRRKRIT